MTKTMMSCGPFNSTNCDIAKSELKAGWIGFDWTRPHQGAVVIRRTWGLNYSNFHIEFKKKTNGGEVVREVLLFQGHIGEVL